MRYVDGFVIPVPKKKIKSYIPMARMGRKMWMKCGALDYKECVGDDLNPPYGMSFKRLAKIKPGETVVFSFIVFKSRAHRDQVNARVMKVMERMGDLSKQMPFDIKRMTYGGFKAVVDI